jgi:hypothetical protein
MTRNEVGARLWPWMILKKSECRNLIKKATHNFRITKMFFGLLESEECPRDTRHCAGLAERFGSNLYQQSHTKAGPTI